MYKVTFVKAKDPIYGVHLDGKKYVTNGHWMIESHFTDLPDVAELAFKLGKDWKFDKSVGFKMLDEPNTQMHTPMNIILKGAAACKFEITMLFEYEKSYLCKMVGYGECEKWSDPLIAIHKDYFDSFLNFKVKNSLDLGARGIKNNLGIALYKGTEMVGVLMPMYNSPGFLMTLEMIANLFIDHKAKKEAAPIKASPEAGHQKTDEKAPEVSDMH